MGIQNWKFSGALNLSPTVMFSCKQTQFVSFMIMRCLECALHLWLLFSFGSEPLLLRASSLIVCTAHLVQTKSLAAVLTSKRLLLLSYHCRHHHQVYTLRVWKPCICQYVIYVRKMNNKIIKILPRLSTGLWTISSQYTPPLYNFQYFVTEQHIHSTAVESQFLFCSMWTGHSSI